MFAKLYETELGQILVKLDDHPDHGAEVRVYFEPEGLGVCSASFSWWSDEDYIQWEKAEKTFEKFDEAQALKMVKDILDGLPTREQ